MKASIDNAEYPELQQDDAENLELRKMARLLVGRVGLRDAVSMLRSAMVEEALERANGSRHGAARLLRVNRRAIQRHASEARS
jgi:DNA-binding NtrC family response regulator